MLQDIYDVNYQNLDQIGKGNFAYKTTKVCMFMH